MLVKSPPLCNPTKSVFSQLFNLFTMPVRKFCYVNVQTVFRFAMQKPDTPPGPPAQEGQGEEKAGYLCP